MTSATFIPVSIAILTISDSRTEATDKSGRLLVENLKNAGHILADKMIVPDNIYQIRAVVSRWIVDSSVQAIIRNGTDATPEAIGPLLDKNYPASEKSFGWCLTRRSKPLRCNPALWRVWPTALTFFACQGHRELAALAGIH